jgi:IS1 family transposase
MARANRVINDKIIYYTDEEQAEHDEAAKDKGFTTANFLFKRNRRNDLLAETDWMANSDVTMTDAWKTYRQALRDLPAADGFPDVDFPTKPS